MRVIPLLFPLLLLVFCAPASAGQKSVTFYLDGAKVEHETSAVKGYLEYPLPDSMTPGSLRVKPAGEGRVLRVDLIPADQDRRRAREIAALEQKKSRLQDQLENLNRREEIFSAAARSQSGKSPRKSKANPDPLDSLQQGTEFALARLDAICRSQRKCRRDIEEIDRRLASARKGAAVARVWLSGRKATVSYLVGSDRWTPSYDFRWFGDARGELLLHARLPRPEKSVLYFVSTGKIADGAAALPVRGDYPVISRQPLVLESGSRSGERPISFTFAKLAGTLPPGEASAFWRGEYLGSGRFSGGAETKLVVGQ